MSNDIIQKIKNIAHEVAEKYLLFGDNMNDTITEKYNNNEIDNKEMLKRICEHANQNVYLAKFQNQSGRKNISFELADFDTIKKNIEESEKSMKLYETPPDDFRSSLEIVADILPKTEEGEGEGEEKTAGIDKMAMYTLHEYKQVFVKLASAIENLKISSMQEIESNFDLISRNTKRMVANGESLGDISKIACRCIQEDGINPTPVMKTYAIIEKELVNNGFNVRTDFTKISSLKINHSSEALKPVKSLSLAFEKVSAFNEMLVNINNVIKMFDDFIKERRK